MTRVNLRISLPQMASRSWKSYTLFLEGDCSLWQCRGIEKKVIVLMRHGEHNEIYTNLILLQSNQTY